MRNKHNSALKDEGTDTAESIDTEEQAEDYFERLCVGDHVVDREDEDDTTLLVTGLPGETADIFYVDDDTVADYNPGYPADDDVVKVCYPQRTDSTLFDKAEYSFPRSRLRLVAPLHDIDEDAAKEEFR